MPYPSSKNEVVIPVQSAAAQHFGVQSKPEKDSGDRAHGPQHDDHVAASFVR